MKKRVLLERHFIFTKQVFQEFYDHANTRGVLAIPTENGNAELSFGFYSINGIIDQSESMQQQNILWGLIHQYGCFQYSSQKYKEPLRYFEFDADSNTWDIYK